MCIWVYSIHWVLRHKVLKVQLHIWTDEKKKEKCFEPVWYQGKRNEKQRI